MTKPSLLLAAAVATASPFTAPANPQQPNVVLVLTDDQGLGDVSFYGNPVVDTPHTDALANEGCSFDQFHVTPMCSPSRAALLSGMNPLKNGVISTCQGLHTLRDYPVLPEAFAEGGYATGMFGKWHLGRNWPNRPRDRGFQETVTLPGFGTTGISSRWNNDYIDTWVIHNGEERQLEGFCTDAFFNEAMSWMEKQVEAEEPFFAFIPTNAPHFPFWAPEEWTEPFKDSDNPEFFAMVKNLDDNMGRLDEFLETQGIKDDTIVIFLSDNGPVGGHSTYNAGMTGTKATPWEGGHRVPLFVRYPNGGIEGGRVVQGLADVTDLFPTLLEICGLNAPADAELEGISLAGAMKGESELPDRLQVVHIQQGELDPKNAAVMQGRWRLLWTDALYDIEKDLAQHHNIAEENPEVFTQLWRGYSKYFYDHRDEATNAEPEIIGSEHQAEVILDGSYWLNSRGDGQNTVREAKFKTGGAWKVKAVESGPYEIILRRWPVESGLALTEGTPPFETACSGKPLSEGIALPIDHATLDYNEVRHTGRSGDDPTAIRFEIDIPAGTHTLHGIFRNKDGEPLCGAYYAYIRRLPQSKS